MNRNALDFHLAMRVLHWLMAAMVLIMLFLGVGMVSTTGPQYTALLALHRPVGVVVLLLVLIRVPLRLATGAPALPGDLPPLQKRIATVSHVLLYLSMIAMPLIGWAMLSAGGYSVQVLESLALPRILPHDLETYAVLRTAHTAVAMLLFALILAHLAAALMHGLIRRDGVLRSMTVGHRHVAGGDSQNKMRDVAGTIDESRG
ncbi:cytochrome b/b6 domain-containing protein [uncultured Sphingosinicella sp.]|uniref:cytochrome b n=1 Tax=uncultured Sphingosinicella sp. TaxID=478748 RepID=UPI0030D86402|tara:strand:- start:34944 stop:35552 length:609 start_codon:yes stop_codon:yes gene_type:complete